MSKSGSLETLQRSPSSSSSRSRESNEAVATAMDDPECTMAATKDLEREHFCTGELSLFYRLDMNFDSPSRSSTDARATSSGSKAPKRLRARTIGKWVANLPAGSKFTISFDDAHRPVGEYKPDYVTRQGVVVRNIHITSLAYKSWHKAPQDRSWWMFYSQEKFDIGSIAERLDFLQKSLGKKWKDYRAELKDKY